MSQSSSTPPVLPAGAPPSSIPAPPRRPVMRSPSAYFPADAALWTPFWLAERAVCSWLALGTPCAAASGTGTAGCGWPHIGSAGCARPRALEASADG